MHPILGNAQIRPAHSDVTVKEVVAATLSMAAQARKAYALDDDRILIVTVPYDPALRDSWKQAEKVLPDHIGGKNIKFDWHKWDVWTIERDDLGGAVPGGWLCKPGEGVASIPMWAAKPLNAVDLRSLAAAAMAMADYLEREDAAANEIEGGL